MTGHAPGDTIPPVPTSASITMPKFRNKLIDMLDTKTLARVIYTVDTFRTNDEYPKRYGRHHPGSIFVEFYDLEFA